MNKIKTSLIVIILLSSVSALAQQSQVKELAIISFPSGAKKLSNTQLRTMVDSNKRIPENLKIDMNSNGEYYQIDPFTLALYSGRVNTNKNYLDDSKKGFEGIFKQMNCSTCTSEIQKINNYTALIVFLDTRDWGYYYFFTIKNDNSALINGSISYDKSNPSNKKRALKTINELLNGMKFK